MTIGANHENNDISHMGRVSHGHLGARYIDQPPHVLLASQVFPPPPPFHRPRSAQLEEAVGGFPQRHQAGETDRRPTRRRCASRPQGRDPGALGGPDKLSWSSVMWVWVKIRPAAIGPQLFGPCFHLLGFQLGPGYLFLSYSHVDPIVMKPSEY